jgi:hypothetical protein
MRDTDLQPLTLPAPIQSAHDLAVVDQMSFGCTGNGLIGGG